MARYDLKNPKNLNKNGAKIIFSSTVKSKYATESPPYTKLFEILQIMIKK